MKVQLNRHIKIVFIIFMIAILIMTLFMTNSNGFNLRAINQSNDWVTSIGTIASLIGIMLAVFLFYISEKAQLNMKRLSEEVHSLSIMTYKNQSLQLLLDNHLKSPLDTKERAYWHYRFSFENYDVLRLRLDNDESLTIKINGTNVAPFQPPAENILTYIYAVEVIDSSDYRIPIGKAYCSFIDGKNKISLLCNQLDLIDPIFGFEIVGPDILHSAWVGDMPKFYNRLKNLHQYKSKDHERCR